MEHNHIFCLLLQTEIAKRLNAILAQIMPFLSQEVSVVAAGGVLESDNHLILHSVIFLSPISYLIFVFICAVASAAGGPGCRAGQAGHYD